MIASASRVQWLAARVLGGAMAGGVIAVADVLASASELVRFVTPIWGRLLVLIHVGAAYAFVGAVLGPLVGLVLSELAQTAIVRGVRNGFEELRAARKRGSKRTLELFLGALVLPPAAIAALALTYRLGLDVVATRHHKGLVVVVVIGATLGLLLLAALVGALVAAGLCLLLRRFVRARIASVLSHPAVLAATVAAWFLVALAVLVSRSWETLTLVPQFRPAVVGIGLLALAGALPFPILRAMRRYLPQRGRFVGVIAAALWVLVIAGAIVTGNKSAVRKAARAGSGLAGYVLDGARRAIDLDRDGYSALFGGGDCNDFDPQVHPGAAEVPNDGIDQNCLGGDVDLKTLAPRFINLPALPPAVARNLNILLVTIDALRADHLASYGYTRKTSPTLDRLAAEGSLFLNGWAHAPSTRYSIPAILTGRYPSQILWDNSIWWPGIRPESETIATLMKRAGYVTGAILNYLYFDRVRGLDRGFDFYDNENARLHQGRDPASTRGSSSEEQATAVIRFINQHASEKFFLWVHFYDPHYEYEVHPGFPSFGNGRIDRYDQEILFTDFHLGRITALLDKLHLSEKTAIVVLGDHGDGFGENGIFLHGYHLYPAQTKVPFILRVPGIGARQIRMPVGHTDVAPTLAHLAGLRSYVATGEGRSLIPEMTGAADPEQDREVYQEVSYEGPTAIYAVVNRHWQVVYNLIPQNTFELYALSEPPALIARTTRDLWDTPLASNSDVERMHRDLLSWIDRVQFTPEAARDLGRAFINAPPHPEVSIGAEFEGELRLVGADLRDRRVAPGAETSLILYFEVVRPVAKDWRIFVHAEGPGRFLADHLPIDGIVPTSHWKSGQRIADRYTFRVPPSAAPGTYTIYGGLFAGRKRMHLTNTGPFDAGADRVRVGAIDIVGR